MLTGIAFLPLQELICPIAFLPLREPSKMNPLSHLLLSQVWRVAHTGLAWDVSLAHPNMLMRETKHYATVVETALYHAYVPTASFSWALPFSHLVLIMPTPLFFCHAVHLKQVTTYLLSTTKQDHLRAQCPGRNLLVHSFFFSPSRFPTWAANKGPNPKPAGVREKTPTNFSRFWIWLPRKTLQLQALMPKIGLKTWHNCHPSPVFISHLLLQVMSLMPCSLAL